jgi:glutaredoxin
LQTLYTSGTVFHAFLGERLNDWHAAAKLVHKIAANYRLPYYTLSPTYSICKSHGYLNGEQHECPICHEKTEVYSRITGYYRPVQNWNDGKLQEFKQRKVYNVGTATVAETQCAAQTATQTASKDNEGEMLLFTTRTCPNCKTAKSMLQKAGLAYKLVVAEEKPELAEQYGIRQAPTIVLLGNNKPTNITGLSDIQKLIDQRAAN